MTKCIRPNCDNEEIKGLMHCADHLLVMKKNNILHEADKVTAVDRQEDYGHPAHDFKRATDMYAPILQSDLQPELKHALVMICVKIARLLNTPDHRDSVVDIAGYARTYEMILEQLNKGGESGKSI